LCKIERFTQQYVATHIKYLTSTVVGKLFRERSGSVSELWEVAKSGYVLSTYRPNH